VSTFTRRLKQTARRTRHRLLGKRGVHYLHIGKTGGSAVKYALKAHTESPRHAIYLHSHGVKLSDVPVGDGVIFFLRDPISRFVSGFYSRQRQGQPRIFSPWEPAEKVAFERFDSPNALAAALSSNDDEERTAAEEAMRSIRHVRSSYADWLVDEAYLRSRAGDVLLVGHQERMSEDFERLRGLLKLGDHVQLPGDDVNSHRNPQSVDRRLDPSAQENLKRWYRRDYQLIDVCDELFGC